METTSIDSTTASAWHPSRATLAARSLAAVDRIADMSERRAAFARHLDLYPATIFAGG